jgi:hypothetical protein
MNGVPMRDEAASSGIRPGLPGIPVQSDPHRVWAIIAGDGKFKPEHKPAGKIDA